MVGVPRSSGCKTCVQKRIKCDETRPMCRECERRNLACPGYPEKFPFCNRHIGNSQDSHHRNKYTVSYRPGGSGNIRQSAAPCSNTHLTMTNMDTKVVPNLSRESLHLQQLEIFSRFIMANFSSFQAFYGPRVNLTWLDFVFSSSHPPPDFLRLAIRCMSTFYLGQTQKQPFVITGSRCLYQYAMASVRETLGHSSVSHYIFAAVFILAAYEMKNGISQKSWLYHANAIADMMQLYHPTAFSSGFGRTLFLTFRPFLIRAAFVQNKDCFMGNEEWVTMVESTVWSEFQDGNGSILGELIEKAFNEVAKVPSLLAKTCSQCMDPHPLSWFENKTLIDAITQCKNRLMGIKEQILRILKDLSDPTLDIIATSRYVGPISFLSAYNSAQGCLEGTQCTLTLLNDLENQVAHQIAQQEEMVFGSAVYGGSMDCHFRHVSARAYDVSPEVGWLDRCALSLGVVPSQ